jgi:hypothetical protein
MNRRKSNRKYKFSKTTSTAEDPGAIYLTRDFSSVEDAPDSFEIIRDIVYRAGKNAANEAKIAGLPQTFARNNLVIQLRANGEEEIIGTANDFPVNLDSFYIRYPPSTILYVRKK